MGPAVSAQNAQDLRSSPVAALSVSMPTTMAVTTSKLEEDANVVDVASANGLSTFIQLLADLGMLEDFRGYGRFTVFAPTNAAFEAVPDNVMQVLLSDRELLAEVLAYHAVASQRPYFSRDLSGRMALRSLQRSELRIRKQDGRVNVNGVRVIESDLAASNGVIHVIESVLIPNDAMEEIQRRL